MTSPSEREPLRFASEVRKHFAFLQSWGFDLATAEATLVRFNQASTTLSIYHGRQSYEIGLAVEFENLSDSYSISELLRLVDCEQAREYRDYATHTVQGVSEGVRKLADLLRTKIGPAIFEDRQLASRLKAQRNDVARRGALEMQLRQTMTESSIAWMQKDMEKVIELLTPIEPHLDSTALKKLEYARKAWKARA